jgi:hypothetical protein
MHMPVLQLRKPHDLGVTRAANELKRANCAPHLQFAQIRAIFGPHSAI